MRLVLSLILAAPIATGAYYYGETAWLLHLAFSRSERTVSPPPRMETCPHCNLILISADTLRADAVDYFADGRTPNMARIATESVRFDHAYANAFYTTPSHMTVFTSLYPNRHHVTGREVHITGFDRTANTAPALDEKYQTLAEVLREQGYRTRWFAPLAIKHLALDLGFGRGFETTAPPLFARPGRGRERFDGVRLNAALTEDRAAPKFYFLHSYVTHLPYFNNETEQMRGMFRNDRLIKSYADRSDSLPVPDFNNATLADSFLHSVGQFQLHMLENAFNGLRLTGEGETPVRLLESAYRKSVFSLDVQLGDLWDQLKDQGLLENSLVVLFSDHGEEFFEHGRASHSSFYDHTSHVAFWIFNPKSRGARRVDTRVVTLVDLMPTLLALLEVPGPKQMQGVDLNTTTPGPAFGFALGSSYVFDGQWKLIRGNDGVDELYNLRLDPGEQMDLTEFKNPFVSRARERLFGLRQRWELEQAL